MLQNATICRLGLVDEKHHAYIIPLNYGYEEGRLYFHSAPSGKKIKLLRRNQIVCFEIDINHAIVNTGIPCHWSSQYRSIIGYGTVRFIENLEEKKKALQVLVNHYAAGSSYEFPEEELRRVTVFSLLIDRMTGKRSA